MLLIDVLSAIIDDGIEAARMDFAKPRDASSHARAAHPPSVLHTAITD
jgi:hypothetical protein